MSDDAKFEDGAERPINLGAFDAEDLQVISALVQDAVLPITEIRWDRSKRRLGLLLNRVRWEDVEAAKRSKRPVERVQSLLVVDQVQTLESQGVDRADKDVVLSLMSISFKEQDDAAGHIELTFAGDGGLRAGVEALEVSLRDVTRPYIAPSRKVPDHPA